MLQVLAGKNASPGKGMVDFQQQHPESILTMDKNSRRTKQATIQNKQHQPPGLDAANV